ncbi:MAG: hypothetical protein J7L51_04385 [Desulfurococcales archaeon]|nr:hypothetical protein [Desulfurococcales archaeon]
MGGGKPKKPLSALDKSSRRKPTELIKKSKEEKRVSRYFTITDDLIKKATRVVSDMDVVTPSALASALGVKVTIAKSLIRTLLRTGALKLIDKSRDLIIAVPESK